MKCTQYFLKSVLSPSLIGLVMLGGLFQDSLMAEDAQPDATAITNTDGSVIQIGNEGTKIIKAPDETTVYLKPDRSKTEQRTEDNLDCYNIFLKDFGQEYVDNAQIQFDDIRKLLEKHGDELQQTKYKLPENYEKNRIACKIFPYDHNIVSSESVPYLNGSKFHLRKFSSYSYIATQAPLETTIADLFMVMKEKESPTLISLVMEYEPTIQDNGGVKSTVMLQRCANFWTRELNLGNGYILSPSDKEPEIIKFEHTEQFIVIRKLMIGSIDGDEHEVEQIHYQHWPDHGTPDPLVFDQLMERVNLKLQDDRSKKSGPLVVHCHAGSGRTGVLIAVRLIQDYIEEQRMLVENLSEIKINIPEIIYEMKLCRQMINSPDQYQFVLSWAKAYIENLLK